MPTYLFLGFNFLSNDLSSIFSTLTTHDDIQTSASTIPPSTAQRHTMVGTISKLVLGLMTLLFASTSTAQIKGHVRLLHYPYRDCYGDPGTVDMEQGKCYNFLDGTYERSSFHFNDKRPSRPRITGGP